MVNSLRRWALHSDACVNLRDLGGYACRGGVTRYGRMLRADQLVNLTEEDKEFLLDKGLTDVVDLRSSEERESFVNSFLNHDRVTLHNVHCKAAKNDSLPASVCMGDEYVKLVDTRGDCFVKLLEIVAGAEGLVIIHCLAGKDRTGVFSALFLLLLGVDELDVIADYQVSETFLRNRLEDFVARFPDSPSYTLSSDSNNIRMMISHIKEEYGGVTQYFRANGMSNRLLASIKSKMVSRIRTQSRVGVLG